MSGSRTRPDCGIALERVDIAAGPHDERLSIDDPREDGLAGVVGGSTYLDAYLRTDCELVRLYAD
ncbi:hypothetical protein BRC89_05620 [Halobacteriales archaeon QS_4_70_19]|nr:MAG: hypothetical protein BRC89_05620 [Halobacteriales archaeon QS_4_70_19]